MRSDKPQSAVSGMPARQKLIAVAFVFILAFLIWEIIGMFRGSSPSVSTTPTKNVTGAMNTNVPGGAPQFVPPQPAQINKPVSAMSPQELQLMQMQQALEARYIAATNELQQLKLSRDIAETNQAIASAKLATVTAEKHILDLLKPEPAPTAAYSHALANPSSSSVTVTTTPVPAQVEVNNYSVISVTELRNRWNAVLGFQGSLFQVGIGDILPADESRVVHIDRTGVILEKNGVKKKISLVSII
jgi:type IV pilus biogenesis protein PilP